MVICAANILVSTNIKDLIYELQETSYSQAIHAVKTDKSG